jgi:putative transposase
MKAHKIRIFPDKDQETYLLKACGTARFAYNWALAKWKELYEAGAKVNEGLLRKELNSIKREDFPWMLEVTKCAPEQAVKNLGSAFANFFRKCKKGEKAYPQFKKKGQRDSFYFTNDKGKIIGKELFVPKLKQSIRCSEELRFSGKIMSYTISRDVDRWYVSIVVETGHKLGRKENKGCVGIDLGIKTLATLSDGTVFTTKKFYHNAEKKLKRLQRQLSRKVKGSANRAKTKLKLARQHRKVRLTRKDYLHQITTKIAVTYNKVVIEDLNVSGMVKNHKLAKAIQNMGFYMFRSFLESKAKQTNCEVVIADRWFPSSKRCSCCGNIKKDLNLKMRVYVCDVCGLEIDRDLNASKNLEELGTCCAWQPVDSVSDSSEQLRMKQEFINLTICSMSR